MRILFISLLAALSLSYAARADAQTFKIATLSPDGSYWITTMKAAAKDIAARTDDRVKFRFYPGGVMGNDKAVLKKIRIGQLQGAALSSGALASKVPDTQIYSIPLLLGSYDEVDFVRQKLDTDLEKKITDAGYVNFGFAEGGFAYIMSQQRITAAGDLKKNKVWVPSDDTASQSAVDSFGIAPVSLSIGDVLTGLQTGLIDTIASPPIGAIALQWHTQVSHILDLPIIYVYALLAIDKKAFKKISEQDQQIVNQVMREAFRKMDKQNRADNQNAFSALINQGLKMSSPDSDQLRVWKSTGINAAEKFTRRSEISPAVLEKLQGLLADYRASQ